MAKIYGLFGAMTGKVADAVMVVRNGEQIVRKYQPVVSNPSTLGQVAARARLKLMSQLSAVCAPVIAIPRKGTVSSRNLFTKNNYALTQYNQVNSKASIALANIQLTESVVALPAVYASRGTGNISANLVVPAGGSANLDVNRVVYCLFETLADEKLRYVTSKVVTEAGQGNAWAASFDGEFSNGAVILAYGVRDNTDAAHARFGNMNVPSASVLAELIVSRTLTETDITLTETRGYFLVAASSNAKGEEKEASKKK